MSNGFFIECGAYDGEIFSNSLFFELKRNWTGLLVEPVKDSFAKLRKKNRKVFFAHIFLQLTDFRTLVTQVILTPNNMKKKIAKSKDMARLTIRQTRQSAKVAYKTQKLEKRAYDKDNGPLIFVLCKKWPTRPLIWP
jgi:hypothetical protein